jgi:hypothetical protein
VTELEECWNDCDNDYKPGPGRDICYDACSEELGEG